MKRGEFLSDQRIKKGLSVSALAQTLGVSEAEIERWESGELPGSEYLLHLSELLEIPVEDILRGGVDEGNAAVAGAENRAAGSEQIGVADGAQDGKGKSAGDAAVRNGGEESTDSHRFDFGELRKEQRSGEPLGSAAPDDVRNDSAFVQVLAGEEEENRNGYFKGERRFGYIVFAVFTVVIVIMLAMQFAGWVSRPRELTVENYRDYLEIDVVPTESANPDDFAVRVTAKEDITDLRITVRVKFWNFFEDEFFETVTVAAAALREDETAEGAIHLSDVALKRGAEVLSVEGDLA